jgi:hypothetical protein
MNDMLRGYAKRAKQADLRGADDGPRLGAVPAIQKPAPDAYNFRASIRLARAGLFPRQDAARASSTLRPPPDFYRDTPHYVALAARAKGNKRLRS